jgi:hypothetical protein
MENSTLGDVRFIEYFKIRFPRHLVVGISLTNKRWKYQLVYSLDPAFRRNNHSLKMQNFLGIHSEIVLC